MAVETEMLRQNKNVRRRMTKAELDMLKRPQGRVL